MQGKCTPLRVLFVQVILEILFNMRLLRLSPLLVLFMALPAMAQIAAYGEYSAAKLNAPSSDWVNGPIFGVYGDKGHVFFVRTGLDLRGSYLFGGEATRLDGVLAGPRLAVNPKTFPLHPYAEGLIGLGQYHSGALPKPNMGPAMASYSKLEYQALGGMDLVMTPRVDWRVLELSYSTISGLGNSSHPRAVSMGIVVHLR